MSALATQDYDAFHTPESERRKHVPAAIDRKPLLDKPSDPHPILNALMDEALLRITLVSDGAVMPLKMRVTGSKSSSTTPSSDLASILDVLGDRFATSRTHRARLHVIKEAQSISDRLRYAPRAEMVGTKEWKDAIATDPRPCRLVAELFRTSKDTVRRIKKEAGTLAQHGGKRSRRTG